MLQLLRMLMWILVGLVSPTPQQWMENNPTNIHIFPTNIPSFIASWYYADNFCRCGLWQILVGLVAALHRSKDVSLLCFVQNILIHVTLFCYTIWYKRGEIFWLGVNHIM
jgi:hypothetical protein